MIITAVEKYCLKDVDKFVKDHHHHKYCLKDIEKFLIADHHRRSPSQEQFHDLRWQELPCYKL